MSCHATQGIEAYYTEVKIQILGLIRLGKTLYSGSWDFFVAPAASPASAGQLKCCHPLMTLSAALTKVESYKVPNGE